MPELRPASLILVDRRGRRLSRERDELPEIDLGDVPPSPVRQLLAPDAYRDLVGAHR